MTTMSRIADAARAREGLGQRVLICDDAAYAGMFDALQAKLGAARVDVRRLAFQPATDGRMDLGDPWIQPHVQQADVLVMTDRHRCPADALERVPRLRGIAVATPGTATVDVAAATRHGVLVAHGGTFEVATGMAEATLMTILALQHRLQAEGQGAQLMRRKVGLVGYGRISRLLIQLMRPFQVRFLMHSPSGRRYDLAVDVEAAGLDRLLRESDAVVMLAGEVPAPLLHRENIATMKPGAQLVNLASGSLVDRAALADALRCRVIAGAAWGAFEDAPMPPLDNLILASPQLGRTAEAARSLQEVLERNVLKLLRREVPPICRNPEAVELRSAA